MQTFFKSDETYNRLVESKQAGSTEFCRTFYNMLLLEFNVNMFDDEVSLRQEYMRMARDSPENPLSKGILAYNKRNLASRKLLNLVMERCFEVDQRIVEYTGDIEFENERLRAQLVKSQKDILLLSRENQALKSARLNTVQRDHYIDTMINIKNKVMEAETKVMKLEIRAEHKVSLLKAVKDEPVRVSIKNQHKCIQEKIALVKKQKLELMQRHSSMNKLDKLFMKLTEEQQKTAAEMGWHNTTIPLIYKQEILAAVARLHNDKNVAQLLLHKGKVATPRGFVQPGRMPSDIKLVGMSSLMLASLSKDKHCRNMKDVSLSEIDVDGLEVPQKMQSCTCRSVRCMEETEAFKRGSEHDTNMNEQNSSQPVKG